MSFDRFETTLASIVYNNNDNRKPVMVNGNVILLPFTGTNYPVVFGLDKGTKHSLKCYPNFCMLKIN